MKQVGSVLFFLVLFESIQNSLLLASTRTLEFPGKMSYLHFLL
jgi:hypothetical protein